MLCGCSLCSTTKRDLAVGLLAGVWNTSYWTFWVALIFVLGILATLASVVLPVWESRSFLGQVRMHGQLPSFS